MLLLMQEIKIMNKELQDELFGRYPAIFVENNLAPNESALGRGVECDDGWLTLIETLCRVLQAETNQVEAPQVVATQIKEKFGTLRFRVRNASERQRAMIEFAEAMSERICETCGASISDLCVCPGVRSPRHKL